MIAIIATMPFLDDGEWIAGSQEVILSIMGRMKAGTFFIPGIEAAFSAVGNTMSTTRRITIINALLVRA
jgi:hypothetical protein